MGSGQCHSAIDHHYVATNALAERLHEAISAAPRRASRRTKALLLSVNEVVDRTGLEPVTSAVQGRRSPN